MNSMNFMLIISVLPIYIYISMCCGGLISVQNFLVVFLNDSFHIVHA